MKVLGQLSLSCASFVKCYYLSGNASLEVESIFCAGLLDLKDSVYPPRLLQRFNARVL